MVACQFHSVALEQVETLAFTHPSSSGHVPCPNPSTEQPSCLIKASPRVSLTGSPTLSGKPASSGEAFTSYDVDWKVKVEAIPTPSFFFSSQIVQMCRRLAQSGRQGLSLIPTVRTGSLRCVAHFDLLNNRIFPAAAKHINGGEPLTLAIFSCSQYQSGPESR